MTRNTFAFIFLAGISTLLPPVMSAQDAVSSSERIVVTGAEVVEKTELSPKQAAAPASVTVLKYTEQQKRNTRDYTDLLRNVTRVAAKSFEQGGVGFGFAMRGFSERSNGGNTAYSIDGVPVNCGNHPSSNGYGDLFPLIPELVDTFVLVRGPFDVRFDAYDLAGSLEITTADVPTNGFELSIGNYDYYRGLLVYGLGNEKVSGYGSIMTSSLGGYSPTQRHMAASRRFGYDQVAPPERDSPLKSRPSPFC